MKIIPLVVGQIQTNCYLVESDGEIGIIDPGDDGDFIIRKIQDIGAKPLWVATTHGHFDHILAVSEICLTHKILLYLHPQDNFLLSRAKETAEYFLGIPTDPVLIKPTPLLREMELSVGKEKFQVLETPGHTPGGICLYNKKGKILFSGDLIFAGGGVGRTDFKYSSEEDLRDSINKIFKLPEEVLVYPGHGKTTTIKLVKMEIGGSKNPARSGIS